MHCCKAFSFSVMFVCTTTIVLLSIWTERSIVQASPIQNLPTNFENEYYKTAFNSALKIIEERDQKMNLNCPVTVFQNKHLTSKNKYTETEPVPVPLLPSAWNGYKNLNEIPNARPFTLLSVNNGGSGSPEVHNELQIETFSNNFEFQKFNFNCGYMLLLGMEAEAILTLQKFIYSRNKNHYYFVLGEMSQIQFIIENNIIIQKLKFKIGIPIELRYTDRVVVELEEGIQTVQSSAVSLDINRIFEGTKVRNHNYKKPFKFTTLNLASRYIKTINGEEIGDLPVSLAAAAHAYNFSYTLKDLNPPSPKAGEEMSLAKSYRKLIEGRVDGHLYIPSDFNYYQYLELSSYWTTFDFTFFTSQPQVLLNLKALQAPFQNTTWILLLVLVVTLSLVFTAYFLTVQGQSDTVVSESASRAGLLTVGPLLSQSTNLVLNRTGKVQFLLILWCFVATIIQNYYSSNLLSHFTVQVTEEVPKNFDELSKNPDFSIFFQSIPGSPGNLFFQESNESTFINLKERSTMSVNVFHCLYPHRYLNRPEGGLRLSSDDLRETPKANKRVCIGWRHIVGQVIASNFTQTEGVSPFIPSMSNAFTIFCSVGFPKQSKIKEEFDGIFQRLRDTGHFSKWNQDLEIYNRKIGTAWTKSQIKSVDCSNKKVAEQKLICEDILIKSSRTHKPFELRYLFVSFLWLVTGSGLALILCIFEILLQTKRIVLCKNLVRLYL